MLRNNGVDELTQIIAEFGVDLFLHGFFGLDFIFFVLRMLRFGFICFWWTCAAVLTVERVSLCFRAAQLKSHTCTKYL